jgi:hypothetical protein
MTQRTKIDELKALLKKANVTDDHMARGVRLTQNGLKRAAHILEVDEAEVQNLLNSLRASLNESSNQYVYETDYMGNVTLRDTISGKDVFLRGDDAFDLIKELKANPSKQDILISPYFDQLFEDINTSSEKEFSDSKGTYNFPHRGMFVTASYGIEGKEFVISIIGMTDHNGEDVPLTQNMKKELLPLAKKWIDRV